MKIKEELSKIVGEENVNCSMEERLKYSKDYSLTPPCVPEAVAYPKDANEVSEIVKWCNKNGIPIVPVSSKIHFYGATVPTLGGIVVDLSRMSKIHEIDTENRFVRFEPGVSWGVLVHELKKKGMRVIMPLTPPAERSPLTDCLEREIPTNVVYDYGEPMQSVEVVWPQGHIFRCGSASVEGFPNSKSRGVNPSGPGIDFYRFIQGAQGTFGIVTWMSMKIESIPKIDKVYFGPTKDLPYTIEFLYRILPRRIGQECLLLNNVSFSLILSERIPEDFENLRKELPPWTLILTISGLLRRPEEKIAYEEKFLNEVLRNEFPKMELKEVLGGFPNLGERMLKILREPYPAQKKHWKIALKGGCQSLFFITKPYKAPMFIDIVDSVAMKFEYPPSMIGKYIQPIEHNRACHVEFNFFFNPEDEEEKQTVKKIFLEASRIIMDNGGFFTRPYGDLSKIVYERAASYTMTLKRLKKIFDPNNIMNPGKLCF
ncbi:MAG: FAD-binding oxidoreductase [Desulfobacterota bacterium]|nr:FAD-binding oxidoreductase [Thermodesulfobacteriota bacterium]MDW8001193.1 FAD-binding oxidoreductase [Deltaproteobacteria bacterium]